MSDIWFTGSPVSARRVAACFRRIYRVTYTAANGVESQQAFAIAVAGDAAPDLMTNEITIDGTICADGIKVMVR